MKYLIILGDGMADEPIAELGGRTPLQAARTPAMDRVAASGASGLLDTVPEGFHPGSEIAHLSLLGYDVAKVFEGRGALEAASMGVEIAPGEMVLRCNLITIEEERIKNHSAGHIPTAEATELIEYLQSQLGSDTVQFYPGVSYRHLLKIRGGDKRIVTVPPHDVPGHPYAGELVRATVPEAEPTARLLNELIVRSQRLLADHPVNRQRRAESKDPANSIWPWSAGYRPRMETLQQRYAEIRSGSVISAVDLIKGIGIYAGLEPIAVEGATGLYDTNYEGKAAAALRALEKQDFVFLHVEASDEAGHEGDAALKVRTIENLDSRVVGPLFDVLSKWEEPVSLAILPDHPTPCRLRTHTASAVPFTIWRTGCRPDDVRTYDELSARNGRYGHLRGDEFIELFIRGEQGQSN